MILSLFTQWSKRARLATARRAYAQALAAYKAADDRQDTRAMGQATRPLQFAHRELMQAELAVLPRPAPMTRSAAR